MRPYGLGRVKRFRYPQQENGADAHRFGPAQSLSCEISRGSRARPASDWGGEVSTSSWIRSGEYAPGLPRKPCRSRPTSWEIGRASCRERVEVSAVADR